MGIRRHEVRKGTGTRSFAGKATHPGIASMFLSVIM